MNFKFKHIKNRFLLQIVFFMFFVLICAGIFWVYSNSVKKIDATVNEISLLKKDIQNAHALSYKILLEGDYSSNNAAVSALESFQDSLNTILELRYIRQLLETNSIDDSLHHAVNNCIKSVQYLILSEKELNTYTHGNADALSSISTDLLTKYISTIDLELYLSAIELKNLESEFLYYGDKKAYNNLIGMIDNISYHSAMQELILAGNNDLTSLFADYHTKAKLIDNIIDRIGGIDLDHGQQYDLENDFLTLKNTFAKFEGLVVNKIKTGKRGRLIILSLITLLFCAAYGCLIIALMKKIKDSLSQTVEFTYNLGKGKFSNKDLDKNAPYEFSSLNQNLSTIYSAANEKKIFVDNLLKQNFEADLSLQGKGDTFGKTLLALKENMRKAREEQLKYSEENRLRRYLNEGIANFASLLRTNSDNLSKLSDIFIRELVKYLEAIQGGVFLVDENNEDDLKLAGAFAYNRKKYLEKTIKKGVGLVGACALEKKSINLTEIPEEYIEITSGLGDAPPTNLLLLPVMHEEKLIGVIELASLNKFETHQIEVGENIASTLASTIISTKINAHTSQLLTKSQQQAAEMAEQEEEMRQNMEELKATQEESARREEDLDGFINAVNQSFFVLEYDTGGTIQSANKKISEFFKLPTDKIIGKTHHELLGEGTKADNLLFASVSEGNTVELTEKITLNNKPVEINNTFSPIKSKTGATVRILNIMTVNFN